ncbi:hypothetical protein [Pseudogemmobacter bohemicus]|uniref:hypothetical protein n=1 Tax=Pseudogemmobacter bohemicus TaxID=2250708 RepID=UPI0013004D1A|nr:hypothetical protein [Pseudogemmobacter bohemicus]
MDLEAVDERSGGQPHDLLPIILPDAVLFPVEGHRPGARRFPAADRLAPGACGEPVLPLRRRRIAAAAVKGGFETGNSAFRAAEPLKRAGRLNPIPACCCKPAPPDSVRTPSEPMPGYRTVLSILV